MIDLSSVPTSPGCYLYKNEEGTIIYVGKAKNLKRRVSSYFQKRDHDPKTKALVRNIRSAEFIVTANEVEALILENTLIKKHSPKYNIDLKDSKSYAFTMTRSGSGGKAQKEFKEKFSCVGTPNFVWVGRGGPADMGEGRLPCAVGP